MTKHAHTEHVAAAPDAVLPMPVVLEASALYPDATLLSPVVLEASA